MKNSTSACGAGLLILSCFLLLFLLPIQGCEDEPQSTTQKVTFEQLFSDPDLYNGENVIIEGFYFHGFEVQVIAEKLEYSGYAEGHFIPRGEFIWVDGGIPLEIYESLYQQQMMGPEERYGKIKVNGKFEYGGKYGHLGGYSSKIIPSEVELLDWSPQVITPVQDYSQEESRQIAEEFVRNSPTFMFDGIEDTLKLAESHSPAETSSGWQFVFVFDSRYAGYGDRTGRILAQVITPHQAVIVVEQDTIIHAAMDDRWDMIKQQEIGSPATTEPATLNGDEVW